MSDHDRGIEFGGDQDAQVLQGGNIRQSFTVASGETFDRGAPVQVDSSGELQLGNVGDTGLLTGFTLSRKLTEDDINTDETVGGGEATMVLDIAVVTTAVTAAVTFAINESVYVTAAGLWSNVSAGTAYGVAMSATAGAAGDTLTMLFLGAQLST